MAKIDVKKMERENKFRNTVHEEVEASYTVFFMDGHKYFQIDTYGKSGRKLKGRSSQILQFDENSVKELIELLSKEFL